MTLDGFDEQSFSFEGTTRPVYCRGTGPGVVVIHEVPGVHPDVVRFAERVVSEGFRVAMPSLFGVPGRPFSIRSCVEEVARACVAREFEVLASRASSPITVWLRALCRQLHAECGGPGVGAIGMCLTGNFALALMVDESVMAPVLSQPSLPFGLTPERRAGLHISDEDLEVIKRRTREGVPVIGMRFSLDSMCPKARFDRLRAELGDAFEAIEIDSSLGNAHGIPPYAHSVVTKDLVDEEGHPTRAALERVLEFFGEQLRD